MVYPRRATHMRGSVEAQRWTAKQGGNGHPNTGIQPGGPGQGAMGGLVPVWKCEAAQPEEEMAPCQKEEERCSGPWLLPMDRVMGEHQADRDGHQRCRQVFQPVALPEALACERQNYLPSEPAGDEGQAQEAHIQSVTMELIGSLLLMDAGQISG